MVEDEIGIWGNGEMGNGEDGEMGKWNIIN